MINIHNCADGKVTEPGLYRMTRNGIADPVRSRRYRRRPSDDAGAHAGVRSTITRASAAPGIFERGADARQRGSRDGAPVLGGNGMSSTPTTGERAAKSERDGPKASGKFRSCARCSSAEGMVRPCLLTCALPLVDMALALGEPEVVASGANRFRSETIWSRSGADP